MRKQALKGGNFRMRQNLNQVTNSLFQRMQSAGGNGANIASQKLIMDRQYYNSFYKYKDSNAKLLNIRKARRSINTAAHDAMLPE